MDDIEKVDVDEDQIVPFMDEINRHSEYVDKEDIIKKIVSMTFGRFLDYYANAKEIETGYFGKGRDGRDSRGERSGQGGRAAGGRRRHDTEAGYKRLFINLGRTTVSIWRNHAVRETSKRMADREIGHIDLLSKFSYIEVPEKDADNVMKQLTGNRI